MSSKLEEGPLLGDSLTDGFRKAFSAFELNTESETHLGTE